jgi:hypothetical protein
MSTSEQVRRRLEALLKPKEAPNQAALDEAERLADLYSNVKVVPYRVPVERFIGVSYANKDENEHFG